MKNVQYCMVVLYIVLKKMATVKKVAVIKKYEDIQKMNTHTHTTSKLHISNILKMWAPLKQPALFSLTASPLQMLGNSFLVCVACFVMY